MNSESFSEHENIVLHTALSTWTTEGFPPSDDPYRRVVGVSASNAETLWTETGQQYDPGEAQTKPLVVTKAFSENLRSFFATFMLEESEEAYNCHRFAAWMTDPATAQDKSAIEEPVELLPAARKLSRRGYIELGKQGLLGVGLGVTPQVAHSFVGLGKNQAEESIEVVAFKGHMALKTYDRQRKDLAAMRVYTEEGGRDRYSGKGIYAIRGVQRSRAFAKFSSR